MDKDEEQDREECDIPCSGDKAKAGSSSANINSMRQTGRPAGDFDNSFDAFQLFRTYLDTQMQTLREDLKSDRDAIASSLNAKLKKQNTFQFKFDGNKKNYLFNCELLDDLEQLESVSHRDCEKSRVRDIKAKIVERNKLIKIADSSPAGWATVNEYISNDLASDSGDEKKIRSAENRALKKLKLSRSTKSNFQYAKRGSSSSSPMFHDAPEQPPAYEEQGRFRGRRPMSAAYGAYRYAPYTNPYSSYGDRRSAGPSDLCFRCGGRGHWGRDCVIKSESRGQPTEKF